MQLKPLGTRKTEVARHKGSEVKNEIVSSCFMGERNLSMHCLGKICKSKEKRLLHTRKNDAASDAMK